MFSLMAWRGKKITTNTKLTKRPIKLALVVGLIVILNISMKPMCLGLESLYSGDKYHLKV